jgi:hypothetical protein
MTTTKYRAGCRKRFAKARNKALNYKGFGHRIPADSDKTHWYYIEYNRETEDEEELIELHWLKVQEPNTKAKGFLRNVMHLVGAERIGISETDFIAISWLGWAMSTEEIAEKKINMAFLFPASKLGDTGIRLPIAHAEGLQDYHDPDILALVFRFCEIDRVLLGSEVSLLKRK